MTPQVRRGIGLVGPIRRRSLRSVRWPLWGLGAAPVNPGKPRAGRLAFFNPPNAKHQAGKPTSGESTTDWPHAGKIALAPRSLVDCAFESCNRQCAGVGKGRAVESGDVSGAGPRIRTIHSGRWLHYRVAEHRDASGRLHLWEYVDREDQRPAAVMVTVCRPSGDLILVRQYRPALAGDTIEFPAGLIDDGETVAEAALRELKEEIGYQGRVTGISPVLCTSSGLTSERAYLVHVEIDETHPANRAPRAARQESERITVLRVPSGEARARLEALAGEGVVIDTRVWSWLAGVTRFGDGPGGGPE